MTRTNNTSDAPLILLSNDDGIGAHGIAALASALDGLGQLCVIAPEREQSAVGHAITVREPVRAHRYEFEVPSGPIPAWAVTGTPADCVKLACSQLLDCMPDLVISGINQGPNTAVNVIYSGTVSAATEACILGIEAAAISLCSWDDENFETAGHYARQVASYILDQGLPSGILLNVNVPTASEDEIKGVRVTRQANARWVEAHTARTDPLDRQYYWLSGRFVDLDEGDDTDLSAVDDGYVSITPLEIDLTAHKHLSRLKRWNWNSVDSSVDSAQENDEQVPSGDE
jgi:5'-nucleotidase